MQRQRFADFLGIVVTFIPLYMECNTRQKWVINYMEINYITGDKLYYICNNLNLQLHFFQYSLYYMNSYHNVGIKSGRYLIYCVSNHILVLLSRHGTSTCSISTKSIKMKLRSFHSTNSFQRICNDVLSATKLIQAVYFTIN